MFNFTEKEEVYLFELSKIIGDNTNVFEKKMSAEFKPWKYENIELIKPKLFNDFLNAEIMAFNSFLKTKDTNLCILRAESAGNTRINSKILLSLLNGFYTSFIELIQRNNKLLNFAYKVILIYLHIYESSFTKKRDEKLYANQQQIYSSLMKTIAKQRQEIA